MHNTAATIARRWFEEVWNERRDATVDELMHPESTGHMEGSDAHGPAEFRQARDAFLSAFPDMHIDVEDVISDGEHAVIRWYMRGTHGGSGFGERATQQSVAVRGMTWVVVRHDRIVEGWDTWNFGGLMSTIGAPAR